MPPVFLFELQRLMYSRTIQAGALAVPAAAVLSALCLLPVVQDTAQLPIQSAHFLTVTIWPYFVLLAAAGETAAQGKNSLQPMIAMVPSGRAGLMFRYFGGQTFLLFLLPTVAIGSAMGIVTWTAESSWIQVIPYLPGLIVENFLVLLPCVSCGLFWGVVCPGPASAGMSAVMLYLVIDLFKNRFELDSYFYSSLYDKPFQRCYDALLLVEPERFSLPECLLLLVWVFLPLMVAWGVFRRKDIG